MNSNPHAAGFESGHFKTYAIVYKNENKPSDRIHCQHLRVEGGVGVFFNDVQREVVAIISLETINSVIHVTE